MREKLTRLLRITLDLSRGSFRQDYLLFHRIIPVCLMCSQHLALIAKLVPYIWIYGVITGGLRPYVQYLFHIRSVLPRYHHHHKRSKIAKPHHPGTKDARRLVTNSLSRVTRMGLQEYPGAPHRLLSSHSCTLSLTASASPARLLCSPTFRLTTTLISCSSAGS